MREKVNEVEAIVMKGNLEKYLRKKLVPVVLGECGYGRGASFPMSHSNVSIG